MDLLEDLGHTHLIATEWPLPPTLTQCEAMIVAHARFHARWWDDPRLGVSVGTRPSGEDTMRHLERLAREFGRLVDRLADSMPPELPGLFERMLAETPRLLKQHRAGGKLTIIQGDAHTWNCFVPRDPASNDVRLFDWDSWRVAPGTDDLAYMMAVHWYPGLRRARERHLLGYYHRVLAANGVAGYTRQALDLDYRLSVLWQLATPIWQAAHDIPPVIWWNNLERVLLAIADLGCRDLLG